MEIEALATTRALEFAQSILEGDLKVIIKGLVEKSRLRRVGLWLPMIFWFKMQGFFLGFLLNCFTLMLKEKVIRFLIVLLGML